jgi:hypothetical protein
VEHGHPAARHAHDGREGVGPLFGGLGERRSDFRIEVPDIVGGDGVVAGAARPRAVFAMRGGRVARFGDHLDPPEAGFPAA